LQAYFSLKVRLNINIISQAASYIMFLSAVLSVRKSSGHALRKNTQGVCLKKRDDQREAKGPEECRKLIGSKF
jgi:hypothetical protein